MPPELDLARPSLSITGYCPQPVLDSLQGFACLLSPRQTVSALSRSWSEHMQRGGRSDLGPSRLLNEPFAKFFAREAQQVAWKKQLENLSKHESDEFCEELDLSSEAKSFHIQLSARGLWHDGDFVGYLIQGSDVTAEHATRSALLDRERKLKESKGESEKQKEQSKEQLKQVATALQAKQREVAARLRSVCTLYAQAPAEFSGGFCGLMKDLGNAKFTVIFGYDDEQEILRPISSCEAPDFYSVVQESDLVELRLGEGPSGVTAAERTARCFSNLRKIELFAPWVHLAVENNFNCIWSFPMLNGDKLVGVFQFYFEAADVNWSAEQQQAMQALCDCAAPLMDVASTASAQPDPTPWQEEIATRDEQIAELTTQLAQAEDRCEQALTQTAELQADLNRLGQKLDDSARSNGQVDAQVVTMNGQMQALNGQIAEHLQQIAQQQSIIQHKEEQLALQRASLVSYSEQIEELQQLVDVLREQLAQRDESEPRASAAVSDAPTNDIALPEENEVSYRFIAGGMAEEFSNLLTGVLGHSSLAAAEMGDSHTAIGDVRAIERAARNAAKLTKRLSALSGEGRRSTNPIEMGEFLKKYAQHYLNDVADTTPVCVTLPAQPCPVSADSASLEVILDGMLEHAYAAMLPDTTCEWRLNSDDRECTVTLHYFGPPRPPKGWSEDSTPVAKRQRHYELFVSREAAKSLGGTVMIEDLEGEAMLKLCLPLADEPAAKM